MNSLEINKTEKILKTAIDVPAPGAAFKSSLRTQLALISRQRTQEKPPLIAKLKPALAGFLILIIAFVVFSNPKIVSAIQSLFYLIPGIGLTDMNENSYVVIPTEPTLKEGVSFQASKGVATKEGIILLLEVKGLTPEMLFTPDESVRFPEVEYKLNLENKRVLEPIEQSARWDGFSGYQIKLVFPASSGNISKTALWLSHTPFTNPEISPNDIEIPITFALFTDQISMLPVIDIQSSMPTPIISVSSSQVTSDKGLAPEGVSETQPTIEESQYSLEVSRMVPDVDGTILFGRIYWTEDLPKMPRFSPLAAELRDSSGLLIPVEYYQGQDDIPLKTDLWLPWGLKTNRALPSGSYSLSFSGLTVRIFAENKVTIPTNILTDPSLLASYSLTLNIGGVEIGLTDITFINTENSSSLSFVVESTEQVESLTLSHEKLSNMNVSHLDSNRFLVEAGFSDAIDLSEGNLIITSLDYHLKESVQTDFLLP